MAEIKVGCHGCGSLTTRSILNESKTKLFWIAANKGTTDFQILMSNLKLTYIGSLTNEFPTTHHDKFDYYCVDCFLKLNKDK